MLALEIGPDDVVRGLALGGRRLQRKRGVVAHACERAARISEERIVGDHRARQPPRGALGIHEVLEPQGERLLRSELIAASE
jgi:hypothetical protein